MVSALSREVDLTDVNNAISSLTLPPAALNAPPVLLIASTISEDSTANLLDTALIASRDWAVSSTPSLNELIVAIKPSVVA